MEIKIHSPVGAGHVSFIWPLDKLKQEAKRAPRRTEEKHSIGEDIIETIRLISEDLPNLKNALDNNILTGYDPDDYYSVKHVCDRYNKMINSLVALEKGTSLPQKRINKYPSKAMLKHILQQTYFRSVIDPDKLNNYEPFSPEVYGETSYDLICDIINHIHFTEEDVFIDLGSGIGQVVLQVAASTSCKSCYGIEKADIPSSYAIQMSEIFQQWMKFYGKSIGEYEILKGDFLSDEYRNIINSATIIFVNNFAFGPSVDHKLKQIFSELKDGTRIFSSKRFCAANFRISNRNLSDIGAIMDISDVELIGQVSWTDKPVQYFLQVIDRSKLELYFERLKLNNMKDYESDSSKSDERNKNGSYDYNKVKDGSDSDDPDFEIRHKKRNRLETKIGSSRSSSRNSKAEVIETYPYRVVIKNDNKSDKWTIKTNIQGALRDSKSNPDNYFKNIKNSESNSRSNRNLESKSNRISEGHSRSNRKTENNSKHPDNYAKSKYDSNSNHYSRTNEISESTQESKGLETNRSLEIPGYSPSLSNAYNYTKSHTNPESNYYEYSNSSRKSESNIDNYSLLSMIMDNKRSNRNSDSKTNRNSDSKTNRSIDSVSNRNCVSSSNGSSDSPKSNLYLESKSSNDLKSNSINDSYSKSHSTDSYSKSHSTDSYSKSHSTDSYSKSHSTDSYSKSHSTDLYSKSHSTDSYSKSHSTDSYSKSHSTNDSYSKSNSKSNRKSNPYMDSNFTGNRLESILIGKRLNDYPRKYKIECDLKSNSESNLKSNHSESNLKSDGFNSKSNYSENNLKSCSDSNLKSHSDRNVRSHSDRNPKSHSDHNPKSHSDSNPKSHSDRNPKSYSDRNPKTHSDSNPKSHSDRNPKSHSDRNLKSHSDRNLKSHSDRNPKSHSDCNPKSHSDRNPKTHSDSNLKSHSESNLKSHSESHLKSHSENIYPENNLTMSYLESNRSECNQDNRFESTLKCTQNSERLDGDQKRHQFERIHDGNRLESERFESNRLESNPFESNRLESSPFESNRLESNLESNRFESAHNPSESGCDLKSLESTSDRLQSSLRSNRLERLRNRLESNPIGNKSSECPPKDVKSPECTPKIPSIVIKTTKQGKSRIIQKKIITATKVRKPKKKKKVIKIPELDLLHEQITKCPEASASFENENFEAYTSSELIKASNRLLDDYKISPVVDNDQWENYASNRLKTEQNGDVEYDEQSDKDQLNLQWEDDSYDTLRVKNESRDQEGTQRGNGSEFGSGSESKFGNVIESKYGDGKVPYFQTGVKRRYDDRQFLNQQSVALDNLLSTYQSQFLEMIQTMQTPEFRQQIQVQIEHERNHNKLLKKSIGLYEDTVKYLMKKGEGLIKERMSELGITNYTTRDLFRTAREWFNEQGHLRNIVSELETQNAELENEIEKRRYDLYKAQYMDFQSQEIFNLHLNNNKLTVKVASIEAEVEDLETNQNGQTNRQIIAG